MAARCSAPTARWARSSRRPAPPAQDSVTGPNPVFTTLFSYDTWNRIQNLTYADGEVVSFNYDSGGNIKTIAGQKQAVAYPYLTFNISSRPASAWPWATARPPTTATTRSTAGSPGCC